MKFAVRNQKDVVAGLIYMVAGTAFSLGALNYKLGDAARMGPGWFPFWIGVLLVAVGMATVASGMHTRALADDVKRPELRAMAWILGAVVLFGLLLNTAGLVLSLVVLVLVSSRASHEFKWKGALLNAVLLLALCVGAFVYGLGLQLPLWPSFVN
jgi:hypothetical protein